MFDGYPIRVALTSLALFLGGAPGPAQPAPHAAGACAGLRALYSPRVLRELRARLLLAYAESHEERSEAIADAVRRNKPVDPAIQIERMRIVPHESDSPRMKHLLAYVAMHCL